MNGRFSKVRENFIRRLHLFYREKNISTVNGFSYTSLSLFPCCFVRDKNTENIANEIIQ